MWVCQREHGGRSLSAQSRAPRIIEQAGPLLSRYAAVVSDVWGVVHDGATAYTAAGDAFARYRAGGGTVLLLSNAPMPAAWVARVLADKGVRRDSWDAIVSSGDITLAHVAAQRYVRVHHIGPPRDLPLFETMPTARVDLDDAQAIVCTGLVDDRRETALDYQPLLERALQRRLPLVCANPDLIVDVGGDLLPCAGVIGALYEQIGGEVYWAGKPHAPAYRMAMAEITRQRGVLPPADQILAIGDAMRTDIAGASAFGLDSLFIAQGIHRDEVIEGGHISPAALARVLTRDLPAKSAHPIAAPVAAMVGVVW